MYTSTRLSAGVDVPARVADGDRADDLTVVQRVYLAGVARYSRSDERVGRKRHRLHLPIGADVKRVGAEKRTDHLLHTTTTTTTQKSMFLFFYVYRTAFAKGDPNTPEGHCLRLSAGQTRQRRPHVRVEALDKSGSDVRKSSGRDVESSAGWQ